MIAAGVDSAARSGVVILDGSKIVRRGTCLVTSWADIERAADSIASFGPSVVAIESPFVKFNADTGLTLARLLGRWLQAIERRGFPTLPVLASTWQPVILAGRMTTRTPGPARKIAAVEWALERFGIQLPEDEADAAAIAWWARDHMTKPEALANPRTPRLAQMAKPAGVRNCPVTSGSERAP